MDLPNRRGTVAAQQDLGAAVTVDELFYPQQKLVSKVRIGAKVSKKYDRAATPHRRAAAHTKVSNQDKAILADTYAGINPAAVQRHIQALTSELPTLTTGKAGPSRKAPVTATPSRASTNESTSIFHVIRSDEGVVDAKGALPQG